MLLSAFDNNGIFSTIIVTATTTPATAITTTFPILSHFTFFWVDKKCFILLVLSWNRGCFWTKKTIINTFLQKINIRKISLFNFWKKKLHLLYNVWNHYQRFCIEIDNIFIMIKMQFNKLWLTKQSIALNVMG